MDRLITNREAEYFCGNGIAFNYVIDYMLSVNKADSNIKVAICSDREVSGYYYNSFEEQFIRHGIKPHLVIVDSRAEFKGLSSADKLIKALVDFDFGKNDWVVCLGGGGVLDICSIAKSLFCCGINYLVVPTTLNSMISGVLSNTAYLNCGSHKNEIAQPFNPSAVIIDPSFLKTVPAKVKTSGYACIIRVALLSDLSLLLGLEGVKDLRVYLNAVYAQWAKIEKNNSSLLTLGDELAYSIERYFRFMNYSEGEALALSLLTVIEPKKRGPIKNIYDALNLPTKLEGCTAKMIIKTFTERVNHKGLTTVSMVDIKDGEYGVFEYSIDEAVSVLESRLKVIME